MFKQLMSSFRLMSNVPRMSSSPRVSKAPRMSSAPRISSSPRISSTMSVRADTINASQQKQTAKVLLIAFASLFMVACGPINVPSVATYTIGNLHGIQVPNSSQSKSTLLVAEMDATPGYRSSRMMYVNVPFKLRAFANHAWVAPPAQMLLPLLAQRIRARGYFKAVTTPPFSGYTTYRLDTNLMVLEQDFLEPTSSVRLVIQATLVKSSTNEILLSRRFAVTVPAPGNNPYSGVVATNQAAAIITKKIARFVANNAR